MSSADEVFCENLRFSYKRTLALQSISFSLGTGVTGILGPNGAGKSTLISILATMARPQSGRALVAGHDVSTKSGREEVRKVLGYLPQRFDLMSSATVHENVSYAAWAHGVSAINCDRAADESLDKVGLSEASRKRAGRLSGGQRQRLGFACAIAHNPTVLLFDEPTVGIDPVQRIDIRLLLQRIGVDATVIVTTHMVEDIQQIASKVLVLRDGNLVFQGTVSSLAKQARPGDESPMSPLERGYHELMTTEGVTV